MPCQAIERRIASLRGFSRVASLLVALAGCLVLAGWALDVTVLKSVRPGLASMKPNTAAAFVLAGVSLWLQGGRSSTPSRLAFARAIATAVALIGLLTAAEYALGWDAHIDELLFRTEGPAAEPAPGRMGFNTAACFMLIGIALLLLDVETRRGTRPAQVAALAVTAVSLVVLLGYFYSVRGPSGFSSNTQMALHTVLAFGLLSVAVLCGRPGAGLMAIVTAESLGGVLARRLLPAALLVPTGMGLLRLIGERLGLYGTGFGLALFAASNIVVFASLVYWSAGSLDRVDAARALSAEALAESEARFRRLAENAQDIIYRYRLVPTRGFEYVNPVVTAITGYTPEEHYADPDLGVRIVHPDYREQLEGIRTGADSHRSIVMRWVRKDGIQIWTEQRNVPVHDEAGTLVAIEGVARDITERRQLEEQLRQAQKMDAIGRLAGGVAHDFNNLVSVILGYSEFVLDQLGEGDRRRADVEEIKRAAESAAALTRQLLAFSRRQILEPAVLDLNGVVTNIHKMIGRLIGEDIRVELCLPPSLSAVKVDRGQIEQVLMNLAVNARDAMPAGGTLTIETANVVLDEGYARAHPAVVPGSYVMLAVSDTGLGMTPEVQARLFEPFFTTKELGRGSGLGLATVYGIVKQCGGSIWVYSEPGHGATFKIYFPVVEEATLSEAPGSPTAEARHGEETILVVEDNAGLRTIAQRVLQGYGYTVLLAASGEEAIQVAERHEGTIDLLLTDVVMPGLDGRTLARRLEAARPALKVLYMSGYTDNAIVHHRVLDPGVAFLPKPFTASDLPRKVRDVLDG